MMTSCPRCGGSIVTLGDYARCIQCSYDGTVLRAPTAQDKIASRHIKSSPTPMRKIDWQILAGDADPIDEGL